MYNRYIPDGGSYSPITEEDVPPAPEPTNADQRNPPPKASWLSGLLKQLHLEDIDTGDILLLLILLFLFLDGEGEGKDMAILLGVLVLFGLSRKKKEE